MKSTAILVKGYSVGHFFIFEIINFLVVVAMSDLVHDVEVIFPLL